MKTANSRLLLVDFENVQQVELAELDDSYRVVIFVGGSQRSVPIELVTRAQRLGPRVEWQRVAGEGRNALDFFIAYHLGRVHERSPVSECIVLSKDKGFDPLLRYLTASGFPCRRVSSLQELRQSAQSLSEESYVERVVELLKKLEKRARPRKRKTLAQSVSAMYQKRLTAQDVDRIIGLLLAKRLISETDGVVHYHF